MNPGFGGQKFIEHTVDKVRELRELITVTGSEALIEVDGGVNLDTGSRLVDAGVDALVAGNAVFSAPRPNRSNPCFEKSVIFIDNRQLATASFPATVDAVGWWNSIWG